MHSAWEASDSGPARRTYTITRLGMEALHDQTQELLKTQAILSAFLSRFSEFVALEPLPALDPR